LDHKSIKKRLDKSLKQLNNIDSNQIRVHQRKILKDKGVITTSKVDMYDALMMKFYEPNRYIDPVHFFLKK
jgi:hypothetical protein